MSDGLHNLMAAPGEITLAGEKLTVSKLTLAMHGEIEAHLLGQAGQLPAPLPFRNFVAQARLGVSRAEHTAFFQQMLGDVDEPTAPFGLTDVYGDGSDIAEARRLVDASLAMRLREHARDYPTLLGHAHALGGA